MRAISVRQAWASLIADKLKRYETRGRSCNWKYRGPLLIHASQTKTSYRKLVDIFVIICGWSVPQPILRRVAGYFFDADEHGTLQTPGYSTLPFGKVLCVVDLVWIGPTEKVSPIVSNQERALGNFSPGRVALDLRNVRRFKEPWPWKGALGLFNVPDEIVATHELEPTS